jgi:hypothetical protein
VYENDDERLDYSKTLTQQGRLFDENPMHWTLADSSIAGL